MGVKGKQYRFATHLLGDFFQLVQDSTVPQMHAIKGANRDDGVMDVFERFERGMRDHKQYSVMVQR